MFWEAKWDRELNYYQQGDTTYLKVIKDASIYIVHGGVRKESWILLVCLTMESLWDVSDRM